jgi:hypothetical protein
MANLLALQPNIRNGHAQNCTNRPITILSTSGDLEGIPPEVKSVEPYAKAVLCAEPNLGSRKFRGPISFPSNTPPYL